MCIRDSSVARQSYPYLRARGGGLIVNIGSMWEKMGARRYACLLYTSDAADERSSVDLGGRRILKKKNNTTIPRETTRAYT